MMQKPWFKIFIWFLATFFFFLISGVIISMLSPGPSESDVMRFVSGMMTAQDRSLMGVAMNIENSGNLRAVINLSSSILLPVIVISILTGFGIRLFQRRKSDV